MRRTTFAGALLASVLALGYANHLSVTGSADSGDGTSQGGKPGEAPKDGDGTNQSDRPDDNGQGGKPGEAPKD